MSIDSVLQVPEPPDLLRRFVETPLELGVAFGDVKARVRTNHESFFRLLRKYAGAKPEECEQEWILVGDPELPAILDGPILMETTPVAILSFGRGCFVALQRDKMELKGFVATGLAEAKIEEVILPRLLELVNNRVTV